MNHTLGRIACVLVLLATGCRKSPEAAQPSPLKVETKSFEKIVPGKKQE